MNKKYVITALIVVFIGFFTYQSLVEVQPNVIENSPEWVPLEKAQSMAAESDKLIMIDVYEIGCKYCRAMDREVFPDSTVRAVLDKDYIPVRLDGNSTEPVRFSGQEIASREFAQSKGAFVFPTTLILDAEGNVIKKRTGFMNADEFRQFLYR